MTDKNSQPKLTTRQALRARVAADLAPIAGLADHQKETLVFSLSDYALDLIKNKDRYHQGVPSDAAFINPREPIEALFTAYEDRGATMTDIVNFMLARPERLTMHTENLCARIDAVISVFKRGFLLGENIPKPSSDKEALNILFREKGGKGPLRLDPEDIYLSALYQKLHPASYASVPYTSMTRPNQRKILIPAPCVDTIMRMKHEDRLKGVMEKLAKIQPGLWPDLAALAGIAVPQAPEPPATIVPEVAATEAPLASAVEPSKPAPPAGRLELMKAIAAKRAAKPVPA